MKYEIDNNGHCNIPDSVTSIGMHAFSYCMGLKSITIPDSVTSIGESAFSDCRGLKSVVAHKDTIIIVGDRWLQIGCKCETRDWWLSDEGKQCGLDNGYTEEDIVLMKTAKLTTNQLIK